MSDQDCQCAFEKNNWITVTDGEKTYALKDVRFPIKVGDILMIEKHSIIKEYVVMKIRHYTKLSECGSDLMSQFVVIHIEVID